MEELVIHLAIQVVQAVEDILKVGVHHATHVTVVPAVCLEL